MSAAIKSHPVKLSRAEELNSIGCKFFAEQQMEPARLHYLAALALEPENPQVLQNLGAVLRNLNHFAAAESVARRSVAASGGNVFARSNLGVSYLANKKFAEALAIFKDVIKDMPQNPASWHNLGLVQYTMGRYKDALESFENAIGLDYLNPQVHSDRALTLLSLERLGEGLEAYECRWQLLSKNKIWNFPVPEWRGEALAGVRLLVHHEQGFGDAIMLSRFVKQLTDQGAIVTLAVHKFLVTLMKRSFPYVNVIDLQDDAEDIEKSDRWDYHTPMLSVMRWLGYTQPKDIDGQPYLKGDPVRQVMNLPDAKAHVGICWASGNHGAALRERQRKVPLTSFLPLTEIPGVTLVSLQVDEGKFDIPKNGLEGIVYDVSGKLDSFLETADMIARLNVVISVDSAVAHIAGALGKPCLMLSPYTRCWRWWNQTSGWPWYRNMTIFRQGEKGTWDEAMRHVTKAIRAYAASLE